VTRFVHGRLPPSLFVLRLRGASQSEGTERVPSTPRKFPGHAVLHGSTPGTFSAPERKVDPAPDVNWLASDASEYHRKDWL